MIIPILKMFLLLLFEYFCFIVPNSKYVSIAERQNKLEFVRFGAMGRFFCFFFPHV